MRHLLEFTQALQDGSFASANDEIAIKEGSQDKQQDEDYNYGGDQNISLNVVTITNIFA